MMCFGFTDPDDGLSVELCEEVIGYRTLRSEGVPIVANIIVRSRTPGPNYLGIWHRADVASLDIGETTKWLDEGDFYSDLFFNLAKGRGKAQPEKSTISVALFSNSPSGKQRLRDETIEDILVPGDNAGLSFPLKNEMRRLDSALVPYTYAKIGPFTGQDQYYAVRVTAIIQDASFDRLVIENPLLGTRYYEVYGVVEILESIRNVDMPRLKRLCKSKSVVHEYERLLGEGLGKRPLIPRFYSIVAVDTLDTSLLNPERMYTIDIQKHLSALEVDTGGFRHRKLKKLKDRVFWFVNRDSRQDFLLWLEGPMGETQHRGGKTHGPSKKHVLASRT